MAHVEVDWREVVANERLDLAQLQEARPLPRQGSTNSRQA